jgi:hypothetical protein
MIMSHEYKVGILIIISVVNGVFDTTKLASVADGRID